MPQIGIAALRLELGPDLRLGKMRCAALDGELGGVSMCAVLQNDVGKFWKCN